MNKLEHYLETTRQDTLRILREREKRETEVVAIARKCFQKGLISGMDLGLIAYKNNKLAF